MAVKTHPPQPYTVSHGQRISQGKRLAAYWRKQASYPTGNSSTSYPNSAQYLRAHCEQYLCNGEKGTRMAQKVCAELRKDSDAAAWFAQDVEGVWGAGPMWPLSDICAEMARICKERAAS